MDDYRWKRALKHKEILYLQTKIDSARSKARGARLEYSQWNNQVDAYQIEMETVSSPDHYYYFHLSDLVDSAMKTTQDSALREDHWKLQVRDLKSCKARLEEQFERERDPERDALVLEEFADWLKPYPKYRMLFETESSFGMTPTVSADNGAQMESGNDADQTAREIRY